MIPSATVIICVSLILFANECEGEIFTSLAEMEKLVESAVRIPELVQLYINQQQQRLQRLQIHTQQFSAMYKQNAHFFNPEALANPTAAYLIVKILAAYWAPIEQTMRENGAEELLKEATFSDPPVVLPDAEDVVGLAKALMMLQSTYQLETRDLADGKLPNHASPIVMTARDCYDVGRIAYERKAYFHTVLWMQETLERSQREYPGSSVNEREILEYLAYPLGELGESDRALELSHRLLTLVPNHPRAQGNIEYYSNVVGNTTHYRNTNESYAKWRKFGKYTDDANYDQYSALCRGDVIEQPMEEQSHLNCYYKKDRPFLKLAPIKVEVIMRHPLIRLFHYVVSDDEIESITQAAFPKLNRSMVLGEHGNGGQRTESRTSKNTWLSDQSHPVAAVISKRVSDMTNLDMQSAEEFQVANYGIGGYYQTHIDMIAVNPYGQLDQKRLSNTAAARNGDRIATVLFYMSQPIVGGATVFPDLNLTLFPSKYDAVFWYNYKSDGQPDMRMRHSGCPVLIGSKWILNKWIHERGQEFNRPCHLHQNDDIE